VTIPTGLPTLLVEASTDLDTLGIVIKFGRKHLKDNDAPPLVIWYPTKDPITDARQLSTDTYQSVRTLNSSFTAFVWGKSYDQSRAIVKAIVRCVHKYNLASCDFGTVEWNVKADESWTVDGHGCLLPVVFKCPITSQAEPIPSTETALETNPTGEEIVTIVTTTPADHEATIEPGTVTFDRPTTP